MFKGSRPLARAFFLRVNMWKLAIGFVVFAGLALYLLMKGGDIDMGGEKHGLANPVVVLISV